MTNLVNVSLIEPGETEIVAIGPRSGMFIEPVMGEDGLFNFNLIGSGLKDKAEAAYVINILADAFELDGVKPVWSR
jgi:hypothetical protein